MPMTAFVRDWKSAFGEAKSSACWSKQALEISYFPIVHRSGARSALDRPEKLGPAFTPGFQHQNVPKQILPVAAALEMLLPVPANHIVVQQCGVSQTVFIQQRFGPVAQWTAQPFAQRNTESHFRPLD